MPFVNMVIAVDELNANQWAVGGLLLDENSSEILVFVNIKVSKGTINPEEINKMIAAVKHMVISVMGTCSDKSYFIVDELNPDLWGFDGITMSERRKLA